MIPRTQKRTEARPGRSGLGEAWGRGDAPRRARAALGLASLGLAAAAGAGGCGADRADADPGALMEADRAFDAATAERGVDGWVSFFGPDGLMVQPGRVVEGPEEIRAFMRPAFEDTSFSLRWEPRRARIADSGDLGYTIGRYRSASRGPDGERREGVGTYVTVWRRQPDGEWRVAVDIGAPDPAEAASDDAAPAPTVPPSPAPADSATP